MPDYRRYYQPNSFVFITSVTANRFPYFNQAENISLFFNTLLNVQKYYSFELFAHVLMPDHFHWILKLPENFSNFSKIIQSFKRNFTLNYKFANHIQHPFTFWQNRFWDHVIRDERDLQNHIDYIHWNPVKHNLVSEPDQYVCSSFAKFVQSGFYSTSNGLKDIPHNIKLMDYE
jgi:putative transposase